MFLFKQKSQDFIVTEELPFKLSWKGDAFYVLFEKRNATTMDIVNHLCNKFKISRLTIGIAWLKDKKAITRQRVSIYDRALKRLWWEKVFTDALSEVAKVIETNRHEKPLNMSTPIKNTFHIRLRANKALGKKEKEEAKNSIETIFTQWFPNKFGEQRFGIEGKNWLKWKEFLDWSKKLWKKHEIRFKLQAYWSKLFNEYLTLRLRKWKELMDWDILKYKNSYGVYNKEQNTFQHFDLWSTAEKAICNPQILKKAIPYDKKTMMLTWPIVGHNILLPNKRSDAWTYEGKFLKSFKVNDKYFKKFKEEKVFWLRRPLRVQPTNTKATYQWDDLLIMFTLPSGSYASIIIEMIMDKVAISEYLKL